MSSDKGDYDAAGPGSMAHAITIAYPITGNVGYVIGRRGATIKRIAAETGAYLKVDDKTPGSEIVNISADNQAQVDAAVAQIQAIIAEATSRPREVPAYAEDVRVERFQAAKVIGRGGENIRRIQDETGARIRVQSRGSGETYVHIEADIASCGEAAMMQVKDAIETARPFTSYDGEARGGGGYRRGGGAGRFGDDGGYGGGYGGGRGGMDYDSRPPRAEGGGYAPRGYGGGGGRGGRYGGGAEGGYGEGGYGGGRGDSGFGGGRGGGYGGGRGGGGYGGGRGGGGYGGGRGGGGYGRPAEYGAGGYPPYPPAGPAGGFYGGGYPPAGPASGSGYPPAGPAGGSGYYAPPGTAPHPAAPPSSEAGGNYFYNSS